MKKVDLYSLLWVYATKAHTPTIKISVFIDFIGKYARLHIAEQPEWETWTRNTLAKFWEEVPVLVDTGKCVIQGVTTDRTIFLTQYYTAMIALAYKTENTASIAPFPDERSLKVQIPDEQITVLRLKEDLADYLDKTEASHTPIISLDLSNQLGSILILDSMIPQELLEVAFLKIHFYFMLPNKRHHALHKLTAPLHKQETTPQELLDSLIQDSNTLIDDFKKSRDSSYLFWKHLCGFIRNDLSNKTTKSSEDSTLLQTVALIEGFNTFFNAKAKQRMAKEKAFEELNACLLHPPYLYTRGDLIKFVGHDGKPLAEYYSEKELDQFLEGKTSAPPDQTPELVALTDAKKEQWFVPKTTFPLVCVQQLQDAHAIIEGAIIEHWLKLLQHYQIEPAMEHDSEFKKALLQHLRTQTPILAAMLEYKRLQLLFSEMQSEQNGYTEFAQLFDKNTGKLLSLNELLLVKRQTLLSETHSRLPFWYSVSPFVKLAMSFSKKENPKKPPALGATPSTTVKKEKTLTFFMVCTQFEEELVPSGSTLDSYLVKLWERWAKLIKEEDRKNLREDVNALVRDRIRRTARLLKPTQITENYLSQTTKELIQMYPALQQLQNNSLELYIKLYLIKLLKSIPR
ncbi:MAG: hypothetical protein LBJ41_05020 [Treponema sp.]|jgi:hypothetical protein|nr:hypothetical protein [Treponema sp.]